MLGILTILKKELDFTMRVGELNLQEVEFGKYYIVKNIPEKKKQFLENII